MRSLLRIAVAAATFLLVGMAVAPGAAHAVNGDERIAQMRLRVVDAVNEGTLSEIQRLRGATSGGLSEEVVRLEAKLRSGWQLAADLRSVRSHGAVQGRGFVEAAGTHTAMRSATGAVAGDAGSGAALLSTPASSASSTPAVYSVAYSVDPSGGSVSGSARASAGGSAAGSSSGRGRGGDNAFEAARAALPDTPVGVLSLIGGGALALVGGGMAAAVVRRPYKKD
ncbi:MULTISPECIES: hypothetical protein [unclassified Streptomyces]|uniref:hypothetical protein n=1 Tax=unclassified Streptomyces TaxID=2593676 RepID=UPI00341EFC55